MEVGMKYMNKEGRILSIWMSETEMVAVGENNYEVTDLMEEDCKERVDYYHKKAKRDLGIWLADECVQTKMIEYIQELKLTRYQNRAVMLDYELAEKLFNNIMDVSEKHLSSWSSDMIKYILEALKGRKL